MFGFGVLILQILPEKLRQQVTSCCVFALSASFKPSALDKSVFVYLYVNICVSVSPRPSPLCPPYRLRHRPSFCGCCRSPRNSAASSHRDRAAGRSHTDLQHRKQYYYHYYHCYCCCTSGKEKSRKLYL